MIILYNPVGFHYVKSISTFSGLFIDDIDNYSVLT